MREAKQRFDGGVQMKMSMMQSVLFVDDLMLVVFTESDEDAERNMKIVDCL